MLLLLRRLGLVVCGLPRSGLGDSRRGTLLRELSDVSRVSECEKLEMRVVVSQCVERKFYRRDFAKLSSKYSRRLNDSVLRRDGMETLDRYPAVMVSESRGCEERKHKSM